jgi:hypothetical protein
MTVWSENMKGTDYLGDLCKYKIILKCILNKYIVGIWTDSIFISTGFNDGVLSTSQLRSQERQCFIIVSYNTG